ncbi:unnamed protein product [Paramecium primaurelia]|uniref:Uncharacterized protein n=1 Tax=Paramecium primaurelia TaxID=5886 RepID=A0A8S1KQS7_PARPR|nr:unnamed protein product [Paramecium primaurelia]
MYLHEIQDNYNLFQNLEQIKYLQSKNYCSQCEVFELGEYQNNQKFGLWKFINHNKKIGCGLYNQKAQKKRKMDRINWNMDILWDDTGWNNNRIDYYNHKIVCQMVVDHMMKEVMALNRVIGWKSRMDFRSFLKQIVQRQLKNINIFQEFSTILVEVDLMMKEEMGIRRVIESKYQMDLNGILKQRLKANIKMKKKLVYGWNLTYWKIRGLNQ